MRGKQVLWSGLAMILVFACAAPGFSQVQQVQTLDNRISQQIVVNGQRANGAYVSAPGGGTQSFTCPTPQQYVTPDGASQGWACYDQASATWLLNALPPAQAPIAVQQPAVVYSQPAYVYEQRPAVVYVQPAPAVVYRYAPYRQVVIAPAYRPSVVIGAAVINAAGRIVSAAINDSHRSDRYIYSPGRQSSYSHSSGRGRR